MLKIQVIDDQHPLGIDNNRLAGFEGWRGIPLLMVIYAHLGLLDIGWIGMQSFFVLSGFLITRVLILDRRNTNSLGEYLKRFYIRRVLRVLPLYFASVAIIGLWVYARGDIDIYRDDILYSSLFVFNFFRTTEAYTHTFEFGHLWSMSVEEQFYLLWPVIFYLVRSPRAAIVVLSAIAATGVASRLGLALNAGPGESYDAAWKAFSYTSCYLDAFAIGALLNFLTINPRTIALAMATVGMFALGMLANGWGISPGFAEGAYLSLGWPKLMVHHQQYVWGYLVINLVLFAWFDATRTNTTIQKFFSTRAIVFLGERSFSTYIWHYPLLALLFPVAAMLGQHIEHRAILFLVFSALYVPITLIIGHLSYHYIELPGIQLKRRFSTMKSH